MERSCGSLPGLQTFIFCFVFICTFSYIGCKPQSIRYLLPLPITPFLVPQYERGYFPVRVPLNPLFVYYVTNGLRPVIDVPVATNVQLVRNEDPFIFNEDPINISSDSEDRDAPARTPTQDSFFFKGTEDNFQQDQCGTKDLSRTDNVKEMAVSFLLRDSESSSTDEGGVVLLRSLDFSGPNTTETAFAKYSKKPFLHTSKITYGVETLNKESPWQVAMFINGKFHCGASLISQRHILTAAHCVTAYTARPHLLELSIGDWDLQTTEDGHNIQAKVNKVIAHSGFSFYNLQNDIAILELKEKVAFNDRIKPICLPPADLIVEGELITVTGWGRNEKNRLETKLQKLTAFVLKNSICADRWSLSGAPRSLIGARTICMDTQFGDSCKGDSGGPAVMEYPAGSGKYVQAGIVSFGSGSCTDFNLPGVYTRVASYRNWITDNIS